MADQFRGHAGKKTSRALERHKSVESELPIHVERQLGEVRVTKPVAQYLHWIAVVLA